MKTLLPIPSIVLDTISTFVLSTYKRNTKTAIEKYATAYSIISATHQAYSKKEHHHVNIHHDKFKCLAFKYNKKVVHYNVILKHLSELKLIIINEKYSAYAGNAFSRQYKPCFIDESSIAFTEINVTKLWYASTTEIKSHQNIINSTKLFNVDLKTAYISIARDSNPTKIYRSLLSIAKINAGSFFFELASTGRFYNSLSNLDHNAVKFLKVNENPTDSLDCVNCQPLLLCKVIEDSNYDKFSYHSFNDFKYACENGTFYESLYLLPDGTLRTNIIETLNSFIKQRYVMGDKKLKLISEYKPNMEDVRTAIKVFFYSSILFSESFIKDSMRWIIDDIYSNLSILIDDLKIKGNENNKRLKEKIKEENLKISIKDLRKEDKSEQLYLWFKLQKLESSIFVKIANESKYVCAVRHDQIVFEDNANQYDYFKKIIKEEFKKININITLK